jgi:hypothetical protein
MFAPRSASKNATKARPLALTGIKSSNAPQEPPARNFTRNSKKDKKGNYDRND